MPANPKYLTTNNWQKFAKISAGFIGGYMVSMSFYIALSYWFNHVNVIVTAMFSSFFLWVFLMILSFLAKNGWKVWGIYLSITCILSAIIYVSKIYHPINF